LNGLLRTRNQSNSGNRGCCPSEEAKTTIQTDFGRKRSFPEKLQFTEFGILQLNWLIVPKVITFFSALQGTVCSLRDEFNAFATTG